MSDYFRADGHIIGKMIAKDCLRYSPDNSASLLCLFEIPSTSTASVQIPVILLGGVAETVSKDDQFDSWYELKGQLLSRQLEFETYKLPKIAIKSHFLIKLPDISNGIFDCEVIGRLTANPEKVRKSKTFEFTRFSLAVNRPNMEQVNFFSVSVFKPKLIEEVSTTLVKGQTAFISGQMAFFNKGIASSLGFAIKLDRMIVFAKRPTIE